MTKLAEIQEAILGLEPKQQQALWAWLDQAGLDLEKDTPELEAGLLQAVDKNGEIVVKDQIGRFRGQNAGPTLGEQLAAMNGSLRTGVRVKSLKGYGRNRA